MDIKKIAEQVSKRIYVEDGLLLSKFISEKFAEALIESYKAELLNVVAHATTNEECDLAMLFFDEREARKYSGDDEPIKLIVKPGEEK